MYRGGVVVAVILTAIVIILIVCRYLKRSRERWEYARENPRWEAYKEVIDGYTDVGIALVAKVGKHKEIIRLQPIGEHINIEEPDWMEQVHSRMFDADNKASVMNEKRREFER
jgi:hypothetical protein